MSVPDARIDERVQDVHDEVLGDDEEGAEEDGPLDRGQVRVDERVVGVAPDPGDVENGLREHGAAEMATSEPPIVTRSTGDRRRSAETIPVGMPTSIQTTKAPTVSESVTGSRLKICERTETSFWYEKPRSK